MQSITNADGEITVDSLLDLLVLVDDRGWYLDWRGCVRDRDGRCPICALVHELSSGEIDYTVFDVTALRRILRRELTVKEVAVRDAVVCAADKGFRNPFSKSARIRRRLIKALHPKKTLDI
jgi:hypothetical protein